MKKSIILEEYNKFKHNNGLKKWSADVGSMEKSVENYTTFGLIDDYSDIIDLLDAYAPIETQDEVTKTFIAFNEEHKDVGAVVLNHVTYLNNRTTLSLFHLIIRPSQQGKQYGSLIMDEIMLNGEKLMGRPVDEICTSVNQQNGVSAKLMKSKGFKIIHTNGNYNIFSIDTKENYAEK